MDKNLQGINIISDKNKLDSIITNLVKNAVKYTDTGSIKIHCQLIEQKIQICVSDTGCGITEDNLNIIFERFRRDDSTISRNIEGSGLGLAITKAYVEKLGGEIWVTSEPGKGSQFYFTIDFIPVG
jgi:signal transduction histidine kinase